MKVLLLMLLSATLTWAQPSGVRVLNFQLVSEQVRMDSIQTSKITALTNKLASVEAMARAVNTADSLLTLKVARMSGVKTGTFTVLVAINQGTVTIPHGLGVTPTNAFAHVIDPDGTGNAKVTANSTGILVKLPNPPLVATLYTIYWQVTIP